MDMAIHLIQKMLVAVDLAMEYFDVRGLFRADYAGPASPPVIISFISSFIPILGLHLETARLGGFCVQTHLNFFHRILDRLMILTCPLSNDYPDVSYSRWLFDCSRKPPEKNFGLMKSHKDICWKDQSEKHGRLNRYFKKAKKLGEALTALDKVISDYWAKIHPPAVDTASAYLLIVMVQFLSRRPLTDSNPNHLIDLRKHEMATFCMAVKGYRMILAKDRKPEDQYNLDKKWYNMLNGLTSAEKRDPEAIRRAIYACCDQYYRNKGPNLASVAPAVSQASKNRSKSHDVLHRTANHKVPQKITKEKKSDRKRNNGFAKVIEYARAVQPYSNAFRVLELAQDMCRLQDPHLHEKREAELVASGSWIQDYKRERMEAEIKAAEKRRAEQAQKDKFNREVEATGLRVELLTEEELKNPKTVQRPKSPPTPKLKPKEVPPDPVAEEVRQVVKTTATKRYVKEKRLDWEFAVAIEAEMKRLSEGPLKGPSAVTDM
jgi:hypothetical protein